MSDIRILRRSEVRKKYDIIINIIIKNNRSVVVGV